MRVIVTGSRDWRDMRTIRAALFPLPEGSTVVHGCATGADAIARAYAIALGHHPEDHWPDYANFDFVEANLRRNQEMVDLGADVCFAFPTENSRGTYHCATAAEKAGIEVRYFAEAPTQ